MTTLKTDPLSALALRELNQDKKSETEYFAALGKFIVSFASAENALHELARKVSEMKDDKARIIFSKKKHEYLTEIISELIANDEKWNSSDTKIILKNCFDQLKAIASSRNKLAHGIVSIEKLSGLFGLPSPSGHFLKTTNERTAKKSVDITLDTYTLQNLREMEIDCDLISLRLFYIMHIEYFSKLSKKDLKFLKINWQYTNENTNGIKRNNKKPPTKDNRISLADALRSGLQGN